MSHWMFNCREVSKKVSETMDRNFPVHHRILITVHLLMCKYCSRFKNQLLILRNAARLEDLTEDDLNQAHSLSKETRQRIKQSIRDCCSKPDKPEKL